jgi:hypothetical protein
VGVGQLPSVLLPYVKSRVVFERFLAIVRTEEIELTRVFGLSDRMLFLYRLPANRVHRLDDCSIGVIL